VIYIAPLKALVRERMNDWGKGLCRALGKKLVELTGMLIFWSGFWCMESDMGVRTGATGCAGHWARS